jgi:hypothetical protein
MRLKPQLTLIAATLAILIVGQTSAKADAVSDWNLIALQRIAAATPGHSAPVTVVELAMVQVAVYDAVQAIEKTHQPYHVEIPGASGSPSVAAAKAAHDVLVSLLPTQTATIDNIYNQYLIDKGLSNTDAGVAVGTAAAAGIIALRANSGLFPPGQVPFIGGTEPGDWRPTDSFQGNPPAPPPFSAMATPWAANITPFALKSGDQYRASPQPPLTSKEYTTAYNEVKTLGARFNSGRTADQTALANFWNLNFFAVWNRVARDLAASENLSIGDNARLFALLEMAMADAGITVWDSKVYFHFWRPLTAIRLGNEDTNDDTVGDQTWEPFLNTPNYPDHTSGANGFTGAATRILALFFDTDEKTFVVTTTNTAPGVQPTKTYNRFSDAADDVVLVRILHGIHFRFADEDGRKQGRHVAQWVFGHFCKPLE